MEVKVVVRETVLAKSATLQLSETVGGMNAVTGLQELISEGQPVIAGGMVSVTVLFTIILKEQVSEFPEASKPM